jgi:thiosulfate dehydrogenase [quinone] large subunit
MKFLKLYLRLGIAFGFLSAVADRFGLWPKKISFWGNWENFLVSTKNMNPWLPENLIFAFGSMATAAEILFGLCLLFGFKTSLFGKLSGLLLLIFGLAMAFSSGIKAPLDYSVFAASGAAFAMGTIKAKFLEADQILTKSKKKR